jgi:hypothetical protein
MGCDRSNVAATEISFWGIPMATGMSNSAIDFAFDYVDEADEMEGTLPVIKVGRTAIRKLRIGLLSRGSLHCIRLRAEADVSSFF